jgi:hypothetical protein
VDRNWIEVSRKLDRSGSKYISVDARESQWIEDGKNGSKLDRNGSKLDRRESKLDRSVSAHSRVNRSRSRGVAMDRN